MTKILKIYPHYRWAFENCDDYRMTCCHLDVFKEYIEGIFVQNDDFKTWFDDYVTDTTTLYDVPYFEWIDIERSWYNMNFRIEDYELKEKFEDQNRDWYSIAEDVVNKNFDFLEVSASGYSQGDYQGWVFVFRKPKSKKELKKLYKLEDCLENNLSKVFTASEFYFTAEIETIKDNETCIKEIDDFEDLWVYNDNERLPEDNEELRNKIEEVKRKYNIDEVKIEDIIYD